MVLAELKKQSPEQEKFLETIISNSNSQISQLDFIKEKQEKAIRRIQETGFPNSSIEDWKYYDFNDVLHSEYKLKEAEELKSEELNAIKDLISDYVYPETQNSLLVTVNGVFNEGLSDLSAFNTEAIEILNFNSPEDLKSHPKSQEITKKFFAQDVETEDNFFKSANTALMSNGFLLNIKDNFVSDKSLQILHISNTNTFNQTRSLIHMGKSSELNMVVDYIGLNDAKYFTNAVIEIILEENAKLKSDKIQNESHSAIQMYNLRAKLDKYSKFELNLFSFGAQNARNDIRVDINGEGADAIVNGLYVTGDKRKSHNLVVLNHNVANATSNQLFKGLLYDEARAEFNGTVNVAKDAQQTYAEQLNRNLLLSEKARVDTRPQLNIFADDVKCSHGATVGQLEEDELFYLESRGIQKDEATTLLTYSYCEELIQKVSLASARKLLSRLAVRNLNRGIVSLENLQEGKEVNRESKKWKQ